MFEYLRTVLSADAFHERLGHGIDIDMYDTTHITLTGTPDYFTTAVR